MCKCVCLYSSWMLLRVYHTHRRSYTELCSVGKCFSFSSPSFSLHPFFTLIFHFRQYYVFYSLFLVYLYPIRWNIIFTPTHFHCWCAKSYGKIRAAVTTFFSLIFKKATTKHSIFISTLTFELNEILIIIGFFPSTSEWRLLTPCYISL